MHTIPWKFQHVYIMYCILYIRGIRIRKITHSSLVFLPSKRIKFGWDASYVYLAENDYTYTISVFVIYVKKGGLGLVAGAQLPVFLSRCGRARVFQLSADIRERVVRVFSVPITCRTSLCRCTMY